MKQSKTSRAWMREHVNDEFVKRAQKEGYRSRASYKLLEINTRDRLIQPGMRIVDLGAAPGGWSQVAAQILKGRGMILAIDLLEMAPLPDVTFIQGDFRETAALEQMQTILGPAPVDLVISDMAPNISGIDSVDQAKSMYLAELALEFTGEHLKPGGNFLVKVFQGEGFAEYIRAMREQFQQVVTRKPKASRDRSNEVYLLGKGRR